MGIRTPLRTNPRMSPVASGWGREGPEDSRPLLHLPPSAPCSYIRDLRGPSDMGLFSSETCGFEGCFRDERGAGVGKSQTAQGWVQDCGGCDSHKVSGVLTVTALPRPRRSTGAADRTQKACRVRGLGLRRLLLDLELVLFDLLGDQQTGAVEGGLQTTSCWLSAGSRVPHTSPAEPPWPNRDGAETCPCRARAALRLPPSPGPPTATMAPTMAPGPEPKGVVIFQTNKAGRPRPRRRAGPRLGRAVARALTCGTSSPSFRRCNTSGSTAGGSLPGCRGSSAEKRRPLHRTRRAQACGERPGRRPHGARGAASPAGRAGSRAPSTRPVCQLQALATDPVPHSSITQARATPE